MARKKDISKVTKPTKLVTEPDLYAINKSKSYREERDISQPNIDRETEISIGKIGKIENPRNTTKYTIGEINILGKHLSRHKVISSNTDRDKHTSDNLTLHSFLPEQPILAKYKVSKIPVNDNKPIGPLDAIRRLIESGFMKTPVTADSTLSECERVFERNFIRESIRNSLDHFVKEEPVLEKHKQGKVVFYKEK